MGHAPPLDDAGRVRLVRRARLLFGLGLGYNAVEAAVALTAGAVVNSTALLAFGLDAVVEVASGLVVLQQLRRPFAERVALRLIGVCFFALAAWVAVRVVIGSGDPETSVPGLALACLSLLVMPWLAAAQRRTGSLLHSAPVVAGSGQARLCAWMSAALLGGLALDAWLGWAWADGAAAVVIAALAVREGLAAWHGEPCCAGVPAE